MALEDYLHSFKGVYRGSPAWFKYSVGKVYSMLPMRIRYGKLLHESRQLLAKSQSWTGEQHREYQWGKMHELLRHALEHVPYYRDLFERANLKLSDIRSHDDWQKIPLLDKKLVREHREELVAENLRNSKLSFNTGGSTGVPLEFYWERGRTRTLERAFMWRQWEWGGFRYGEKIAVLRGQSVNDGLWHYDPIDSHLFVNSYNLTDENMKLMLDELRKFRPIAIHTYPSVLSVVAAWMKANDEPPLPSVKTLLCGSENLYPAQKELFEEVFNARVYSWYGHAEVCCLAGFCEHSDDYHVFSEYGYAEIVAPDGSLLPWKEGQKGELVATSLVNNTMPLIRYRTGDVAVVGPERCSCGRHYPLIERIEGRQQEYVVTSDNRAIALTGLVFGQHWHAFAKMEQMQFVQEEPGKVVLRIVKRPDFDTSDEAEIRTKVQECVLHGLDLAFEYVEEIPRTPSGKHIFVKQSVPLPETWSGEVG